jgi:hypothetical protein
MLGFFNADESLWKASYVLLFFFSNNSNLLAIRCPSFKPSNGLGAFSILASGLGAFGFTFCLGLVAA